jgi:hypothetical protein
MALTLLESRMKPHCIAVAFTVLVFATGAAACGSDNNTDKPAAPPKTTPSTTPNTAKVDLSLSGCNVNATDDVCWLPVQTGPKLIKGQSMTPADTWPLHGSTVTVQCKAKEMADIPATNNDGEFNELWLKIRVPANKLTRTEKAKHSNGATGWIGGLWVPAFAGSKQADQRADKLPNCDKE